MMALGGGRGGESRGGCGSSNCGGGVSPARPRPFSWDAGRLQGCVGRDATLVTRGRLGRPGGSVVVVVVVAVGAAATVVVDRQRKRRWHCLIVVMKNDEGQGWKVSECWW